MTMEEKLDKLSVITGEEKHNFGIYKNKDNGERYSVYNFDRIWVNKGVKAVYFAKDLDSDRQKFITRKELKDDFELINSKEVNYED